MRLPVLVDGEELDDGFGDTRADLVDGGEVFRGGVDKRVDGAELLCEQLGCALANEADAEAHEDASEAGVFGAGDLGEQGIGGFFADTFEVDQLLLSEAIDVGDRFYQRLADQDGLTGFSDCFVVFVAKQRGALAEELRDH